MAATAQWCEDNGAATGSPSHGTTRSGFGADTHFATDVNSKNVDDCTANGGTAYSAAPINQGAKGYIKYQYLHFSGAFNAILNGIWSAHTATALGANLTLVGKVTSTYATPVPTAMGGATDFTAIVAIGSGIAVSFSTTGPEDASPTAILAGEGYSQYLAYQMQIGASAATGDTAAAVASARWDEN